MTHQDRWIFSWEEVLDALRAAYPKLKMPETCGGIVAGGSIPPDESPGFDVVIVEYTDLAPEER